MTRCVRSLALAVLLLSAAFVAGPLVHAAPPSGRLRIVLLVDSSSSMSSMIPQFRAGLKAFLDALPGEPELALVSTGGQLRIRVPPTTDREQIRQAAAAFAPDGGGNAFIDALLETDKRFFRNVPDRMPVFVIITTDGNEVQGQQRIDEYNRFAADFVRRGGRAHGIVVKGINPSITTDVLMNFTKNTGGFFDSLAVATPLADRMRALVELLEADMLLDVPAKGGASGPL